MVNCDMIRNGIVTAINLNKWGIKRILKTAKRLKPLPYCKPYSDIPSSQFVCIFCFGTTLIKGNINTIIIAICN